MSEISALQTAIRAQWRAAPSEKAKRYMGQFFETTRSDRRSPARCMATMAPTSCPSSPQRTACRPAVAAISAKAAFATIAKRWRTRSSESPQIFREVQPTAREAIRSLADLQAYLQGVTLETLLAELKANGITQTAFAASIGMNTRHLSAVKSSELRNHFLL